MNKCTPTNAPVSYQQNEVYKFLEIHKLPKLSQEEIENLNRPRRSKEIESVIKNLRTKKNLGPDGSISNDYKTFKELTPILLSNSSKNRREQLLTPSMTPASSDNKAKDTRRKLQTNFPYEYKCKNPQHILASQTQQYFRSYTP